MSGIPAGRLTLQDLPLVFVHGRLAVQRATLSGNVAAGGFANGGPRTTRRWVRAAGSVGPLPAPTAGALLR
jgi:hypothetical protein